LQDMPDRPFLDFRASCLGGIMRACFVFAPLVMMKSD
jgi:hypothetical protein